MTQRRLRDSVQLVALAGELDMATAPSLTETLDAINHGTRSIVLDLGELRFIDSHGVRALLGRAHASQLIVVRPSANVSRVLALTCADRILRISDSLDDALAALEEPAAT